jgi:hypothetical protein
MQQLYFYEPFAFIGDKTSIPFPTDSTGLVSFNQGYGPDYALDLNSNPSAIALDRTKDNFLWYSVTNNLQNYQQYGIPEWITTADNQGAAFPYDIGATVRYRSGSSGPFQSYVSLITSNTNTPSNDGVHWSIPLNEAIGDSRYAAVQGSLSSAFNALNLAIGSNDILLYDNGGGQLVFRVGTSSGPSYIKFDTDGTISASPAITSTEVVTLGQADTRYAGITTIGNIGGTVAVTSTGTLPANSFGSLIEINATSGIGVGLPASAVNGDAYIIFNNSAYTQIISANSGNFFGPGVSGNGSGTTSTTQASGTIQKYIFDGSNWIVLQPNGLFLNSYSYTTSTRSLGTVYTNTSGKPMFLSVSGLSRGTGNNLIINVNGAAVSAAGNDASGVSLMAMAMVPPGATYEVFNVGGGSFGYWTETN